MQHMDRTMEIIKKLDSDCTSNWPNPSPNDQLTELRLLLDERLVGNCDFHSMQGPEGTTGFFLATPRMSVKDVVRTYGRPTSMTEDANRAVLTYGALRFIGIDGDVFAVLFPPRLTRSSFDAVAK